MSSDHSPKQVANGIADKLRSDLIGGALICHCGKCGLNVNKANKIISKSIATAISNAEERGEIREREACAKLADGAWVVGSGVKADSDSFKAWRKGCDQTADVISKAIRARGSK